jgi:uncharacterized protein
MAVGLTPSAQEHIGGSPITNAHGPKSEGNPIPLVTSAGTMRGEMLYRELGSTGESVSVIGMGGSHLGLATVEEDLAIRLVHEGLDRGINFLDNCWDYDEGRSEERVGKALSQEGYRQKAFVMTKIDGSHKGGRCQSNRDVVKEVKSRPHRSPPAPRDSPL